MTNVTLQSLHKRVLDLEKHVYVSKTREMRGMSSFTHAGGLIVIANVLSATADVIVKIQTLLNGESQRAHAQSRSCQANALAFSATLQLQGILDSFAGLCAKMTVDGIPHGNTRFGQAIYFDSCDFVHDDVVWVNEFRSNLRDVRFDGKTFKDFANFIKHEQPWIAMVSESRNVLDLYDTSGKGYVYSVLLPVYRIVKSLLEGLAQRAPDCHVTMLPSLPRL